MWLIVACILLIIKTTPTLQFKFDIRCNGGTTSCLISNKVIIWDGETVYITCPKHAINPYYGQLIKQHSAVYQYMAGFIINSDFIGRTTDYSDTLGIKLKVSNFVSPRDAALFTCRWYNGSYYDTSLDIRSSFCTKPSLSDLTITLTRNGQTITDGATQYTCSLSGTATVSLASPCKGVLPDLILKQNGVLHKTSLTSTSTAGYYSVSISSLTVSDTIVLVAAMKEITKTLTFKMSCQDPAESVRVTYSPSTITQGQNAVIRCTPKYGNPPAYTYMWEFTPRYSGITQSLNYRETVTIDNIQRSQAGKYTCTVTSGGGSTSGDTYVIVQYKPEDINTLEQKVLYTELNKPVTVILSVRAYPEPTKYLLESANYALSRVFGSKQQVVNDIDAYDIKFSVIITDYRFYGNYSAVIGNQINGELNILVHITQKGPPEKPKDFHYKTVTAKSVTLVWVSGKNGGYTQTFSIERKVDLENQFSLRAQDIADPGLGETVVYKFMDLQPLTTYQFKVSARNLYNGGASTIGDVITVTTLALPTISGFNAAYSVDNTYILNLGTVQGNYSRVVLQECPNKDSTNCMVLHNINFKTKTVSFQEVENKVYVLAVYQSDTEVYRETIDVPEKPGSNIGVVIGPIITVIIVVLLVFIAIVVSLKRKKFSCQKTSNNNHTGDSTIYYNSPDTNTDTMYSNPYETVTMAVYEEIAIYTELNNI